MPRSDPTKVQLLFEERPPRRFPFRVIECPIPLEADFVFGTLGCVPDFPLRHRLFVLLGGQPAEGRLGSGPLVEGGYRGVKLRIKLFVPPRVPIGLYEDLHDSRTRRHHFVEAAGCSREWLPKQTVMFEDRRGGQFR